MTASIGDLKRVDVDFQRKLNDLPRALTKSDPRIGVGSFAHRHPAQRPRDEDYGVSFTLPPNAPGGAQEVGIVVLLDASTPDRLEARVVSGEAGSDLVFDRVDSIDPPLVPVP